MRTLSTVFVAILALSVGACGTSEEEPGAGTPTPTDDCKGSLALTIRVTGAPAGSTAKVTVKGTTGEQVVPGTGSLSLVAGEYTVTADDIVVADPIVRTIHRASVSKSSITVCNPASETIDVTYAPIASSGKLWMSNANGSASTLGFASSVLAATSTQPASVVAETAGSKGIAFDRDGNLWEIGSTVGDPTLVRYAASTLGASGKKTADRKIDLAGSGCSPAATALAFDTAGNLWVSSLCDKKVFRVGAAQLAADGEITPSIAVNELTAPRGLAFDASGNLWIADGEIRRFDAARLAASTTGAADASLTVKDADSEYLAFDGSGNLWSVGGSQWNLSSIAKADLSAPGAREVTPTAKISVGVGALPDGIAFDESGGLWISTSAGKFARLAPTQLGTSTTYAAPTVPERSFTSPDVGSGGSIALFPAPAALPLYAARP